MNWKNLKLITDADESKACVSSTEPAIICSSSGMLMAGRSIHYLKSIIPNRNSTILFISLPSFLNIKVGTFIKF